MNKTQLRPARVNGTGLGFVKATTPDISEHNAPQAFDQRYSPVEWLAARARVALPTARLHAELFGIGGCR